MEEKDIDNKVKDEIKSLINEIKNEQISKKSLKEYIENNMKIFKINDVKYSEIPNRNGVYFIIDKHSTILEEINNIEKNASKQGYKLSQIQVLKGKVKRLAENTNSYILYIGKAEGNNKIKGRLRQYFGSRKKS